MNEEIMSINSRIVFGVKQILEYHRLMQEQVRKQDYLQSRFAKEQKVILINILIEDFSDLQDAFIKNHNMLHHEEYKLNFRGIIDE